MLETEFSYEVYEKFKSYFFFLKSSYNEEHLNELALEVELQKYNKLLDESPQ